MWVLADAPASPVNFSIQDLINQMIQNDSEVYEVYFIRCSDTLHAKGQCTFTHDNNLEIHNFKTCPNFSIFPIKRVGQFGRQSWQHD